ncbi:hypothetical protein DM01DRAFT_1363377 [Hesseltinella vesiculosa]|uniref:S-adenosyl-L-methionine-dependent methyltransferase n=1 Tax=Hesseltinella vesiculosa TaxID=101127 RepID=A0A1X2GEN6_9FUNG|nr:hypothetical protein DM01DRAFT_1363377 [Hesseltinella vesiculosa]
MLANQFANNVLMRLVSGTWVFDDDRDEGRMEQAARLMAHLSGRGAPLLAKKLIQQRTIPHLADVEVLELGTGTGMVGIVCDKLGAKQVTVTDYHPNVLKNVAVNLQLNTSRCHVAKLDFIEVAQATDPLWIDKKYPLVIASDLLYEMEHADHLPVAVEKLMIDEFYFMIPLRPTHWQEVQRFEQRMEQVGLYLRRVEDAEQEEDEGTVHYRYYEYARK